VDLPSLKNVEGVQLIVDVDDVQKVGGGFVEWLRGRTETKQEIKEFISPLPNRKDAMLNLQEAFKSAGIRCEFEIINGMAHNSAMAMAMAIPNIIQFLQPRLTTWHLK
jgi:hypothetical protein